MSLTDEIKKTINYTAASVPKCSKCRHSKESENIHVDRMWDRHCYVAVIHAFSVSDDGRCDRFEPIVK